MADTAGRRVFDAPTQEKGPVPAYKVYEVDGPFEQEQSYFDEKTRTIGKKTVTIEKGYMVLFPRGHSNFYSSLDALEHAGFGEVVPLIQMNLESEMNKDLPPSTVRREIERGRPKREDE